jgi:hypothetical protein
MIKKIAVKTAIFLFLSFWDFIWFLSSFEW